MVLRPERKVPCDLLTRGKRCPPELPGSSLSWPFSLLSLVLVLLPLLHLPFLLSAFSCPRSVSEAVLGTQEVLRLNLGDTVGHLQPGDRPWPGLRSACKWSPPSSWEGGSRGTPRKGSCAVLRVCYRVPSPCRGLGVPYRNSRNLATSVQGGSLVLKVMAN